MTVAFFILMHSRPEQAIRLIQRLDGPGSMFVVHVDRRAKPGVYDDIERWAAGQSHIHLARRVACRWGGFGIVAATLECIRTALRSNVMFDRALLLSGQDYPIKPLQYVLDFVSTRQEQFIESFRLDLNNRWTTFNGPYQSMARISWYNLQLRRYWLHIPAHRRLPLGMQPYGGSQWWCLSRECLTYVDEFVSKHPEVLRHFRRAFIPDECFFQTIISNSQFGRDVVSDDLHYIDFTRPNPNYPRTFETSDYELLRQSPKLFARKFDMARDQHVLDLIDHELLVSP